MALLLDRPPPPTKHKVPPIFLIDYNSDDKEGGEDDGNITFDDNKSKLEPEYDHLCPAITAPPLGLLNPPEAFSEFHTRLFEVLCLYPQLEISLHNISLKTTSPYAAISHRWGEESVYQSVTCNGQQVWLRPSLIECIRHVTQQSEHKYFWLDAVCINQKNEDEKSQQVSQLWKIFGDAQVVYVYLGDADEYTETAMKTVSQLSPDNELSTFQQTAIAKLLDRPWFTRLWTMQEAVLARKLLVVCGPDAIEWDHLRAWDGDQFAKKVAVYTATGKAMSNSHQTSIQRITSMRNTRSLGTESDPFYCREILNLMVNQDCYLPVDRVYGVLGLLPQKVMRRVKVEYSADNCANNYWSVYTQFVRAIVHVLDDSHHLIKDDIKLLADRKSNKKFLPRWCPDFNALHALAKEDLFDFEKTLAEYEAAKQNGALERELSDDSLSVPSASDNTASRPLSSTRDPTCQEYDLDTPNQHAQDEGSDDVRPESAANKKEKE